MNLGRLTPPDWEHVRKYPLTAATVPAKATAVVLGINWYSSFDHPVKKDGRYWIGLGALGGFAGARAASLNNRARYDAPDLYFRAQDHAGQPRDPQTGSYIRSVLEVLRVQGPKTPKGTKPSYQNGIAAYRWAQDAEQVLECLQTAGADRPYSKAGAIPFVNSWGRPGYPHVVWMLTDLLGNLLPNGGEAGVITDR